VVDDMGRVHGPIAFDDLIRDIGHQTDTLTDAILAQTANVPRPAREASSNGQVTAGTGVRRREQEARGAGRRDRPTRRIPPG
jgi:hypothetical protein